MARITIEQIFAELQKDGWKLISTEYKNLDSELEFQCNEGHDVFAPWSKIRTRRECPVCKNNIYKQNSGIPKIKKEKTRVLAFDQASHTSGYSVIEGNKLLKYGAHTVKDEEEDKRIHAVKMWALSLIENWNPDVVAIEGIQYQDGAGVTTFQALARLQGVLIEMCMELEMPYRICPTNTWRGHCGVKGRSRSDKKTSMQMLVKGWFDITVSDDCADAIGIGKYTADNYLKREEIISWE